MIFIQTNVDKSQTHTHTETETVMISFVTKKNPNCQTNAPNVPLASSVLVKAMKTSSSEVCRTLKSTTCRLGSPFSVNRI